MRQEKFWLFWFRNLRDLPLKQILFISTRIQIVAKALKRNLLPVLQLYQTAIMLKGVGQHIECSITKHKQNYKKAHNVKWCKQDTQNTQISQTINRAWPSIWRSTPPRTRGRTVPAWMETPRPPPTYRNSTSSGPTSTGSRGSLALRAKRNEEEP